MKKTVIVLSVIAIAAAVGFACFTMRLEEGPTPPDLIDNRNPLDGSGEVDNGFASTVIIEAVNVENRIGNIDIDNTYPVIKSFKNKEFENSINTKIAGNISDYRAEISHIVDEETPDTKLYKYITTFDKYTWGDYLTLVINQDYQTGGIRSNSWKDIYNIDTKTEQIIYLADIFSPTVDYENEIINEIIANSDVEFMGGEGLKKLPDNQKFYIKDGKLIIYFDPSEVASAKYGALEFEMPFTLGADGYFKVD